MAEFDPKKKALADALSGMTGGQPAPPIAPSTDSAASPRTPVPSAAEAHRPSAPAQAYQPSSDDMLAMAAYKARFAPIKHAAHDPMSKRRTLIPILLTGGVLLIGLAVYILTSRGEEGIYDVFPHWTTPVLILGGVLSLGLAFFNMYKVKHLKND